MVVVVCLRFCFANITLEPLGFLVTLFTVCHIFTGRTW